MAAALAVAAAMATATMGRQRRSHGSGDGSANMAPTVAEGAADVGGDHLSYLLLFA
jgi:hypothetical protein